MVLRTPYRGPGPFQLDSCLVSSPAHNPQPDLLRPVQLHEIVVLSVAHSGKQAQVENVVAPDLVMT